MPFGIADETAAVTALCQAPDVIFDAEVLAVLHARGLLAVAAPAFAGRLRFVPETQSLLLTGELRHLHDGFVAVADIGTRIFPFLGDESGAKRLLLSEQIGTLARSWDAEWSPPRARAAISSLFAGRKHNRPVVTAYPYAERLAARASGWFRVIWAPDVVLFLAHRQVLGADDAKREALAVGEALDPDLRGRRSRWAGRQTEYTALVDDAINNRLCPGP